MKHVMLIVNASAGRGAAGGNLYDTVLALAERGYLATVCPVLPGKGLTGEKYLEEAERYDVVACIGGDGTLSHVINGYVDLQIDVPLAYLPTGSTNDFSRSLGLRTDIQGLADTIAGEKIFHYDIGRFNNTCFNYVAAFGAFTDVSYKTSQQFKNIAGHAAYILSAIADLPGNLSTRCDMTVTYDGGELRGEYLYGAVSNARSVGGFELPFSGEVQLDDGLFEVMLVQSPNNVFGLNQIISALVSGNLDNPCIHVFQASSLTFVSEHQTTWTTDGEFGGALNRVEISSLRGRIPMLIP